MGDGSDNTVNVSVVLLQGSNWSQNEEEEKAATLAAAEEEE